MKRYFPFVVLLLFLALIFGFSAQSGNISNGLSYAIANKIEGFLVSVGDQTYHFNRIDYTVRKLAHFSEYMMLAVLIAAGVNKLYRKIIPSLLISGVISVCIAYADEMLQKVAVERTSSLFDVMIDSAGAFAGLLAIGVFSLFRWIEAPKKHR